MLLIDPKRYFCCSLSQFFFFFFFFPVRIHYKSIAGRYRPVSYPDGPITARYRFIKNAYWVVTDEVPFLYCRFMSVFLEGLQSVIEAFPASPDTYF